MQLFNLSIYDVGGDGTDYLFLHYHKTEEEFKADVNGLAIQFGEEYIKQEDSWISSDKWIDFCVPHMFNLGYTQPKTINYSIQNTIILNSGDKFWEDIVGKELFDKGIEHNQRIHEGRYFPEEDL